MRKCAPESAALPGLGVFLRLIAAKEEGKASEKKRGSAHSAEKEKDRTKQGSSGPKEIGGDRAVTPPM